MEQTVTIEAPDHSFIFVLKSKCYGDDGQLVIGDVNDFDIEPSERFEAWLADKNIGQYSFEMVDTGTQWEVGIKFATASDAMLFKLTWEVV